MICMSSGGQRPTRGKTIQSRDQPEGRKMEDFHCSNHTLRTKGKRKLLHGDNLPWSLSAAARVPVSYPEHDGAPRRPQLLADAHHVLNEKMRAHIQGLGSCTDCMPRYRKIC